MKIALTFTALTIVGTSDFGQVHHRRHGIVLLRPFVVVGHRVAAPAITIQARKIEPVMAPFGEAIEPAIPVSETLASGL